jgi:hypothetical protein
MICLCIADVVHVREVRRYSSRKATALEVVDGR